MTQQNALRDAQNEGFTEDALSRSGVSRDRAKPMTRVIIWLFGVPIIVGVLLVAWGLPALHG